MSENINFIPATELPEAEGDEVSVLCVENGELKQKAASGLGGGNYDAVVSIVVVDGVLSGELISGSYEEIREKVLAGDVPNIKVVVIENSWRYTGSILFIQICENIDEDPVIWFYLCYTDIENYWGGINPDGTIEF